MKEVHIKPHNLSLSALGNFEEDLFTANIKMTDLIQTDYRLLYLLPRFDIELGFGDKTIEECCLQSGVSVKLFLMVCNVYSFGYYLPLEEEIEDVNIHQLIGYLKVSHDYYRKRFTLIEEKLKLLATGCEDSHGTILNLFFSNYQNEVIQHFLREEKVVFPYIEDLLEGDKMESYNIESFEQTHSNIDDKLNDLKNILIKYLHSHTSTEEKAETLFQIFSLEEDLTKHTLIEDKVLIPSVRLLEIKHGK